MSTEQNHTVGKLLARIDVLEDQNRNLREVIAKLGIHHEELKQVIAKNKRQSEMLMEQEQRLAELEAHETAVLPLYERIAQLEAFVREYPKVGHTILADRAKALLEKKP